MNRALIPLDTIRCVFFLIECATRNRKETKARGHFYTLRIDDSLGMSASNECLFDRVFVCVYFFAIASSCVDGHSKKNVCKYFLNAKTIELPMLTNL